MAKVLGLTIPPTLPSIANKVIEETFCTASFNGGEVTQWVNFDHFRLPLDVGFAPKSDLDSDLPSGRKCQP
jgi:hypothetical protein